jgi:putative acetyltransferase
VDAVIFRRAVAEDILAIVTLQQEGGVLGLSHIFPQDRYPFPEEIVRRWHAEIDDPTAAPSSHPSAARPSGS